jgi:hypothetical protein
MISITFACSALSTAAKLFGALHLIHLFANHCFDFDFSLFAALFCC